MAAVVSPLLFDEPSVPSPPPPSAPLPDPNAAAAASEEEATAAARRRAIARAGTGRLGTITTSARGILAPSTASARRRSLLGE